MILYHFIWEKQVSRIRWNRNHQS